MWSLRVFVAITVFGVDGRLFELEFSNITYTEGDRFFYMPDDDGVLQVCDTQVPEDSEYLDNIIKAKDLALYMLYTRSHQFSPQFIRTNDVQSLQESRFDISKNTKLIVHGWGGSGYSHINTIIKDAFLAQQDVNVVVVDWELVASGNYIWASKYAPAVGRSIANILKFIYGDRVGGAGIHLVGHSLGGQVVGFAGRELGGLVARITSLDPALPLWGVWSARLRRSDARYVEVMHTNAGVMGQVAALGHADFYPNGGSRMAGCALLDFACSHTRSLQYFAESLVRDEFVGTRCKSVAQAQNSRCIGKEMLRMGNSDLEKPMNGIFHLYTNAKSPYARG